MAMLLVIVWMLVLGVMVRFRNDELDDAD
jgi:hypothetical protein